MHSLSSIVCTTLLTFVVIAMSRAAEVATLKAPDALAKTDADSLPRGMVSEKPSSAPYVETELGYMVPYTEMILGTDVTFEMIPVPGGVFVFGDSSDADDRGEYVLPSVEVELPPFWIARHEITWAAYWPYMRLNDDFAKLQTLKTLIHSKNANEAAATRTVLTALPRLAKAVEQEPSPIDGVTAPTALYDESTTYECGKDPQQPAATMTPYAAKQFTKWLSHTLGVDYRLPTEAEWEYAARAGSTTAYPYGDDPSELDEYAWYEDNSDGKTHPVGEKKPNAWGLHDMIGNVAEWVIDEYSDDLLERTGDGKLSWEQAIHWPTHDFGRVVRGGFWDDLAEDCRSTSRFFSEDVDWKSGDPNLPLSPWWYAAYPSAGVGIRLVRPLHPLSPELAKKFWEPNSPEVAEDVATRVAGGRGKLGVVNSQLPHVQAELENDAVRELLESDE
ncbi:MAG: formylglycine-generating enzyme family protein [Aeoliella sp.]